MMAICMVILHYWKVENADLAMVGLKGYAEALKI